MLDFSKTTGKRFYTKSIEINVLMALCEMGENYKVFCDDIDLIISKEEGNWSIDLYKFIKGEGNWPIDLYKSDTFVIPKKFRLFVEKHSRNIEIMIKYDCLYDFTVRNYDNNGQSYSNLGIDYFYNYIGRHLKEINLIKLIVCRIKLLGIRYVYLDEELDFTTNEYFCDFSLSFLYDHEFSFLENMNILSVSNNLIKYTTTDSCYSIQLNTDGKTIKEYNRKILLNCLTFNPNRLPNDITINSTFDVILKLANKCNKSQLLKDIQNSIKLYMAILDLKQQYERLKNVYESIDKIKNNQEFLNLINQMNFIITKLQSLGVDFETQIIDEYVEVTPEIMEKEKRMYLDRKILSSIDIDD